MNLPIEGVLLKKRGVIASVRLLERERDLASVKTLQEEILYVLGNNDIFHPADDADFENYFSNGFGIGVFDADALICYAFALWGNRSNSYCSLVGYDSAMESQALDYADIVVHTDYRGNSLHALCSRLMVQLALDLDKQFVLAYVSPNNPYSLENLLRVGFRIIDTKLFDFGYRYIMRADT